MDERSQGEEAEELKAQECGPEAWKHHETSKDHQISIKTLAKSRLWRKISMDWPSHPSNPGRFKWSRMSQGPGLPLLLQGLLDRWAYDGADGRFCDAAGLFHSTRRP